MCGTTLQEAPTSGSSGNTHPAFIFAWMPVTTKMPPPMMAAKPYDVSCSRSSTRFISLPLLLTSSPSCAATSSTAACTHDDQHLGAAAAAAAAPSSAAKEVQDAIVLLVIHSPAAAVSSQQSWVDDLFQHKCSCQQQQQKCAVLDYCSSKQALLTRKSLFKARVFANHLACLTRRYILDTGCGCHVLRSARVRLIAVHTTTEQDETIYERAVVCMHC